MAHDSQTQALLRRRDALKRSRTVWLGGLVVWGVVVGWILWGLVNAITDDVSGVLVWAIVWLLPVLVLAAGAATTHLQWRRTHDELVRSERR